MPVVDLAVVGADELTAVSPDWRYIHTHFGVGYRFTPEPHHPATPTNARVEPGRPVGILERGG